MTETDGVADGRLDIHIMKVFRCGPGVHDEDRLLPPSRSPTR